MPRRARFDLPRTSLALHPKAWDSDFEVLERAEGVAPKPFRLSGSFAVVEICGPLHQHDHWLFDSYDSIRARAAAAAKSSAPSLLLCINSPGGDFAGSLELSRELRAMAKAAGKRLVAFTDCEALSAGYALATAAEELVLTDSAAVGSVGVWAPLIDQTALDRAMGLRYAIVASGERKVDRNPHVEISESAMTALQGEIDAQAELFFRLVAEHRGLPAARVAALQGASAFGARAVNLGLADRIATLSEVLAGAPVAAGAQSKGSAMAKEYEAALDAMRKAADEEPDEEKKASMRKAIKGWEDMKEASAKEGEGEGEGEAEGKGKAGEGEPPPKKDKEGEGEGKAAARAIRPAALASAGGGSAEGLELARELQQLRARLDGKEEAEERAKLMAQRPDFDAKVVAFLEKQPLAAVREAVKTFPWAQGRPMAPAAAAGAVPSVQGLTQGDMTMQASAAEQDFVAKQMGYSPKPAKFEIGTADRGLARKYLEDLATRRAAGQV